MLTRFFLFSCTNKDLEKEILFDNNHKYELFQNFQALNFEDLKSKISLNANINGNFEGNTVNIKTDFKNLYWV